MPRNQPALPSSLRMVDSAPSTPRYRTSPMPAVCTCTRVLATSSGEQSTVESTPAPMPEIALAAAVSLLVAPSLSRDELPPSDGLELATIACCTGAGGAELPERERPTAWEGKSSGKRGTALMHAPAADGGLVSLVPDLNSWPSEGARLRRAAAACVRRGTTRFFGSRSKVSMDWAASAIKPGRRSLHRTSMDGRRARARDAIKGPPTVSQHTRKRAPRCVRVFFLAIVVYYE